MEPIPDHSPLLGSETMGFEDTVFPIVGFLGLLSGMWNVCMAVNKGTEPPLISSAKPYSSS